MTEGAMKMYEDAQKERDRLKDLLQEIYDYLEWKYQVDHTAGYEFELAEKTREALNIEL